MGDAEQSRSALVGDEAALVARIRAGDERAFETVFRAVYDELCAFADRYVRAPDVAEELVEDVFFGLWERRATWEMPQGSDRGSGLRRYLFAAVRNRALNVKRHGQVEVRRRVDLARELEGLLAAASAAERLEAEGVAMQVRRAVAALGPARQRVLALRWGEGRSYAEIAREMGSSVRAVEVQLARALRALRRALPDLLQ